MNEPRTLPYEFRAFSEDGYIYLFDNSEDCYLCSLMPSVWCECIDHARSDPDADPDPYAYEYSHYRDRKWIDKMDTVAVETIQLDPDYGEVEFKIDAWDRAREMVLCNNYGGLY